MEEKAKTLLKEMIRYLLEEKGEEVSFQEDGLLDQWRGLINQRPASAIDPVYLQLEDQFLPIWNQAGRVKVPLSKISLKKENLYLFKGDITNLEVDAIVNAANSKLLGCFIPNHQCIDNWIQTRAGVRMRLELADQMAKQGHAEAIGKVKWTLGYHLPAQKVFHTVGPHVDKLPVSGLRQDLLKKCYLSCLEEADKQRIKTIAFPCLSTGEFHFPKDLAGQIAYRTVRDYLEKNQSSLRVIFNVFTSKDEEIYHRLLEDNVK